MSSFAFVFSHVIYRSLMRSFLTLFRSATDDTQLRRSLSRLLRASTSIRCRRSSFTWRRPTTPLPSSMLLNSLSGAMRRCFVRSPFASD